MEQVSRKVLAKEKPIHYDKLLGIKTKTFNVLHAIKLHYRQSERKTNICCTCFGLFSPNVSLGLPIDFKDVILLTHLHLCRVTTPTLM